MLLFFDGFDHYNAWDGASGRKWDVGSNATPYAGRFEGQAVVPGALYGTMYLTKTVRHCNTMIVGCALILGNYQNVGFMVFSDDNGPQLVIGTDTITGHLTFTCGSTVVGTSGIAPPVGIWCYLEVKFQPGGLLVVYLNEVQVASFSGVPDNQGSGYVDKITFQAGSGDFGEPVNAPIVDDLYILDTLPDIISGNTDFLGDVRVQTRLPDAAGTGGTAWTPAMLAAGQTALLSSANRADQVNAPVVDMGNSALYNYDGTVNDVDLYSIANFSVAGAIYGVQSTLVFRKGDVGTRSVRHMIDTNSGGPMDGGVDFDCYSSYTMATKLWTANPVTGLQWSLVDLNAAEFGVKISV